MIFSFRDNDSRLSKLFIELIGNDRVPSNIYIYSSRIRFDEPCELVSTESCVLQNFIKASLD